MIHDLETEEQHDLFPGNSILGVLSCRLLLSLKKEITAGEGGWWRVVGKGPIGQITSLVVAVV